MSFRRSSSQLRLGRTMRPTSLLLFALALFAAQFTFGQGITTGAITGTIQDQQQQVISGANVTVIQNGTNTAFAGKTNSVGSFEVRGLPVGTYTVTIDAAGFTKMQLNNVATSAGRSTSIGVRTLGVASSQESVTVEASAPILQTDTMQIGETFQTRKLADLPVGNGLDIVTLFTPGVAPAGDSGFSNQGELNLARTDNVPVITISN